ncbi:MAG: hypothetical protein IPP32_14595 [Bacteroidetes bacterium]|nr:hypothetical protein [Bacteroidota bacterium]
MKTLKLFCLACIFFSVTDCFSSIVGNNDKKTLFVDYFGLTIYNVDENADTVFEREEDLITYALNHGFKTLILKSLDRITYGSGTYLFIKNDSISCGLDSASSSRDRKYMHLASFLSTCRNMGIQHIAAGDTPFGDSTNSAGQPVYTDNLFFKNILKFNEFYSVTSGYKPFGYFDVIFGESDYWAAGNPSPNAFINWRDFYLKGLRYMKSLKNDYRNTRIQYTATYIGDLTKVPAAIGGGSAIPEVQADSIDRNVDWLYIEYYINGKDIVKTSPTATNAFFLVDRQKGARLYYFSRNSKSTVIIPLFGSLSGNAVSQQNYFGDYLDYESGYHYATDLTLWHGPIDSVTAKFEYYYTHVTNPYNPVVTDPLYPVLHTGLTMKQLTEDSISVDPISGDTAHITGNILYSDTLLGVAWFKYSTMPDATYYLKTNLDRDAYWLCKSPTFSLNFQDEVDEVINTGLHTCTISPCRNLSGITGYKFDVGITTVSDTTFKWYKNGQVIMGQTSRSLLNYPALTPPDTTVPFLTTITVEAEITSYKANGVTVEKGIFDHVRLRKEYSIFNFCQSNTPVDHFEVLELTEPTCPNFNNGSVNIQYYSNWVTCSGHEYHYHNDSTNIDYIGDSANNYTVSNLTAGSYTVKLWCDSAPTGDSTVFSLYAVNTISTPTIYSQNNEFVNCYDSLSTDSFASYTWIKNGVDIPFYSAPSYQAIANGSYSVRVTDSAGCVSTSDPVVINLQPENPTVLGSTLVCIDSSAYTVVLDTLNNPVSYTWGLTSGTFTQDNNSIYAHFDTITTGWINVYCAATNACGVSNSNSLLVHVKPSPLCPAVTASNTSCITATVLNWTTSTGCVAGYKIYLGTSYAGGSLPSNIINGQDVGNISTFSLPILTASTKYYFSVAPYDFFGVETLGCNIDSFTCGASQAVSPTLSTTINLGLEGASVPAVPCGITIENYDGLGTSNWYTSTAVPRSGSNHMRIDKNPDNTTGLYDWFFSPPINVTKGHAYRVSWYDRIASGTITETYKVYIGTSADASTLLGDGPLFNGISSSTTYHKDSAIDYLATSSGQIYFGFWATSPANQGSIYIDDIQIKEIQVTIVDTTYCNTTLSSANLIYAYSVSGVSNYKYKFVGTGAQAGYSFEHGTSNSNTSFYPITQAPGVIYGYTYNVSVSYKKNNIWSPYGASCPVTLSAFPQNKLVDNPSTPGLCDYIVTDQHELINVTPIAGATKYQYKIVENDTTNSYVYDTTSTTFNSVDELRLDMAAITPKVRYGYYYNVKVRALVGSTNSTYGSRPGEWGTFGPTCVVNVSGLPTTSLTSTYCNTNQTTLNDIFYVTPISSASQYRYHITASGYNNTIETSNSNSFFRFTSINPAVSPGGVKYGTIYSIEAAASVGGAWLPYGSACTLTTPTAPLTKLQTSQCDTSISSGSTFLYWDAIYGASNYQYKVSGTFSNGYRTREIYRNNSNNFFILSWANQTGSTILANQTYYVQVRYYAGQWEAYGDSCSITTNSNYSRYIDSLEAESPSLAMLSMNVYPNPNPYHSEFSVELNGIKDKNQKVDLFIFSSEGSSVYRAAIVSKEENRIVIKPQIDLAPGVYIVLSDVNGVRLQKKFVVE